jgi:VanZ family protein
MTSAHPDSGRESPIPALLCVLVLCGILLAGMLPFRGPHNGVAWLNAQNGVSLTGHATLWSTESFPTLDGGPGDACTIEIWLQPGLPRDSSAILAFTTPQNPLQLTFHQYSSLLIVETRASGGWDPASIIGASGVFHQGRASLVTISSGPHGTAIYANGVLSRVFPGSRIAANCNGRLVLGTSPTVDDSWRGQIYGLGLYGAELSSDQVRAHYENWTKLGDPSPAADEHAVAVYPFNERSGSVVHNIAVGGMNLEIPKRYALVHQYFLRAFWHEYKSDRSYWKDVFINIVGLMPLGFIFYAYLTAGRPLKHAVLITTLLGFAVSLTIEVTQSFIPTRDSGTTDLITNTFGTFLGVQLYRWNFARAVLARIYSLRIF